MSLHDIQLKQKKLIETEIHKLLDLLHQTEQSRDVAASPVERAKYESEILSLKSSIEEYKNDLKSLEKEIVNEESTSKISRSGFQSYRVRLDDSLPDEQLNNEFAVEVQDFLCLMGYEIANEAISGALATVPPTFITNQEGDFEALVTLFQCVYGIVDEATVLSFCNIYELNRKQLSLNFGIIISNTYIAPSAKSLASQYRIQLITFEDLLNTIFKITRYLKAKCKDYEKNNKLYRTYVEVKYLRRGKGRFKDGQATQQEFLVTEAIDGGSFEAKGELTPYIDSWLLRDGNSQICLLGEYGTGKTSFATQYFYRRAVAYLENPLKNRIPLLVTLNRYHKSADIEQMMTDFLVNECGIRRDFDTFLKLAVRGKLLVILDGFDEMAKQVDVNIRRRNFREISQLLVGNNKVVLSGRPNYFVTQAEIDEIFTQEPQTEDPYKTAIKIATSSIPSRYEILGITLFDRWQIEEFIKKQSEYLRTKGIDDWRALQKAIYETYNLEELARTPVLLEIIIKTISEIRGKVSHINAAKLYQIYTDFWLNREYDEKGDVRWLVTRKEKELFVLSLAWTMLLSDNMNPEIHFSKLSERVRSYFDLEKATEIEYFSSDIRFCSYLTHSETDGNYRFIHKSFMEYFSARRIYKALLDEQDASEIITDKPITDEVFFFLCQMIDLDEVTLLENLTRKENDKKNKEFIIGLTARVLQQGMNINEQRGVVKAAETWVDKLLLYCEEFNFDRGKLWGLTGKGKLKAQLGQYTEAEIYYREALSISEQMGERLSLSQSLIQLGTISQSLGKLEQSLQYYEQALIIFEKIGDRASVGQTLTNVGTVCQYRGELDKSLEYYQRALAIFEEIGERGSVGKTLSNVAEIYQTRGEVDSSLQYSQHSLAIFREIGDRRSERKALSQLGSSYQKIGRYNEAERIYQESLAIAQEIGDRQGASRVLSQLGSIYTAMARLSDAERYYQEALAIAQEIGDQEGVGNALSNMGGIYQNMADYEKATSIYKESIAVLESIGNTHAVGINLYNLANAYSVQGRPQESLELYRKSLDIFEKMGDLHSTSIVIHQLGVISQNAGKFEQAESFYKKAFDTSEKIGDVRNVQNCLESLGNLAEARQNFTEAERLYTAALDISLKIGDQRGECELSVKLGKLSKRNGDAQKTIGYYGRYLELARKMKLSVLADVAQEYDQLRAERYNPFIVGAPVRDEASFYGRTRELDELYNRIQRQQNVMLVGERRMGKTSLLHQLMQRLELPYVAVLVDLQTFPGQAESLLNGVIRQTVDALLREGLLSSERWEKYSLTYARDFVKALESMIDEAGEKLKDIKIVLILDEVERLLAEGSQAAGVIRATLEISQNIVAVVAGTNQLAMAAVEAAPVSPFFNIFTRINLLPLSKDDTEILISQPSKHIGVSYQPAAIERIYELSGGIPYYAQVLGSEIIDTANQEKKNKITLEDVDKLLPELLERISHVFQYNLNLLNKDEITVLSMIVNGEPLKDVRKQSIRDLENKQMIVKENGSYRFVSKLFMAWFEQYGIT